LGIATVPDARGAGVGKALLRELIQVAHLDGHPGLSLSVDDGNTRALKLYEHTGFVPVERVGDGWTMVLEIPPAR